MKTIYNRSIKRQILHSLKSSDKIIVLYGARQVGKTTLAKQLLSDFDSLNGYFNCEEFEVRDILSSHNSKLINNYLGNHPLIVLDEAQTIPDIGRCIKIYHDAYPDKKLIATGSSSFELANRLNEPLTGRKSEFFLYPLSLKEIADHLGGNKSVYDTLNSRIVFGSYPEIVNADSEKDAKDHLISLSNSYLYKDILQFNAIKKPDILTGILRALAYQTGGIVSYNEIASLVGIDQKTVISYIDLLQQAFIIFRLDSYSANLRNEIKKKKKFYFYDNGILNAVINDFNGPLSARDMGALWENLMMTERRKNNQTVERYVQNYFWQLRGSGEIDLIEEENGRFYPFEFKWNKDKTLPSAYHFESTYDNSDRLKIINKRNFGEFLNFN